MPLSSSRIPNLPLTGPELRVYSSALLHAELEMRGVPEAVLADVVAALDSAAGSDFLFLGGTSYPSVRVEIQVRLHYRESEWEYAVKFVIYTANPLDKIHPVFVRGTAPLPLCEGTKTEAFTLTSTVDNPNLVRVHYGMPIVLTRRKDPEPGQIFSEVESEALEYDPSEFEAPAPPEVKDETEEAASSYGIKPSTPPAVAGAAHRGKGWNKGRR